MSEHTIRLGHMQCAYETISAHETLRLSVNWDTMGHMSMTAAGAWEFSSPQGLAHYRNALASYPAQCIVDLRALRDNMRHLVSVSGDAAVMGVVKADAYGHGLIPSALAALAGGATWLGTAQAREALALRRSGIGVDRCHILTWVYNGTQVPFEQLIEQDIDISVGSFAGITRIAQAARHTVASCGKRARVHVKVDSGFGRNGFTPESFDQALAALVPLVEEGLVEIIGQWSHLAVADSPDVPEFVASTDKQIATFHEFTARMKQAGIEAPIRHLANTAATLDRPDIHFELTRPGVGLYGYEPDPAMGTPQTYRLRPAMTLQAQLGTVKDVAAGHGISYGRTYLTPDNTSTAIVPIGYADGIHRSASGFDMQGAQHVNKPGGPVRVMTREGARVLHVSGRVCMDQFIVDLHGKASDLGVQEGDTVVLFGPGRGEQSGEPTADDWARAADTISYEIFTCLRNRIPRLYVHAPEVLDDADLALLDPQTIL